MWFGKKEQFCQSSSEEWRETWKALVPEEHRDVNVTLNGSSIVAFVQINQFVMMLQDGLLMEESFFPVCSFFQEAGYHVIWLMRCTQDIHNGYLKLKKKLDGGRMCRWLWKSPTTNFGRWSSDNLHATILLQHEELDTADALQCQKRILQRVHWAESDDPGKMVPGWTEFQTVDNPGTAEELLRWLSGEALNKLRNT